MISISSFLPLQSDWLVNGGQYTNDEEKIYWILNLEYSRTKRIVLKNIFNFIFITLFCSYTYTYTHKRNKIDRQANASNIQRSEKNNKLRNDHDN